MAGENKIITIEEAQALLPGSFPSVSGDELKRCPMKSELLANGFSITGTTRTYEDNQTVVAGDLGGYDVTYVLGNVSVVYSTSPYTNMIFANGSNYAYIKADVTKLVGGRPVSGITDVTLESVKVSGEGFSVSASTYIKAADRKMVTGGTRDGIFYGVYSDSVGISAKTSNLTATQAANIETQNKITTSATYRNLVPVQVQGWGSGVYTYQGREVVSSDIGRYYAMLTASFKEWYSYSSGAHSQTTATTTGLVTATTYTIPASVTWASLYTDEQNKMMFNVQQNTGTSNRTGSTVTARYSGGTDTNYTDVNFTLEQFRTSSSYTDYRVSQYNIDKTEWQNSESGYTTYATLSATCQYNTSVWKNGTVTPGTWTTYTSNSSVGGNKPFAVVPQGHFKFYGYDGSMGGQTIDLYYPNQYYTYGTARVYPYSTNTGVSDITNTLQIRFAGAQQDITLTQKGDGSFNISPTSLSFASAASSATITVTTYLTDWSVSDNAGWVTTSVNGNNVTVTVTENASTTQSRSAIVSFSQGGRTVATCPVSQTAKPVPPTPTGTTVEGIYKLFELGDGWIVGYYISSKNTSPCNWNANTLVIARNDAGSDTTFSLTGHYDTHMCGTNTDVNWSRSSITYTAGTKLTGTALSGETQWDCYGFSIGGGPGANTQEGYAGISII